LCEAKYAALFQRDRDITAPRDDIARLYNRFATLATPPIKDSSASSIGRKNNAPLRFAVDNIRFFIVFFLVVVFFFSFILMPILLLAFIASQTAAAVLSQELSLLR